MHGHTNIKNRQSLIHQYIYIHIYPICVCVCVCVKIQQDDERYVWNNLDLRSVLHCTATGTTAAQRSSVRTDIRWRCTGGHSFIHSVVYLFRSDLSAQCNTELPQLPAPSRFLKDIQYLLTSSSSSSRHFYHSLYFPSITCFRRQFPRKI